MIRLRVLFYSLVTVLLVSIVLLVHLWARSTEGTFKAYDADRPPVLIELFTSEGCSDCPPADALLERLDRSQPIGGAEVIVLSEHVDYWNGPGWKDPYSSHEYSQRQNAYASVFGLGSVYTPQMVVDGSFEFVGSDERRAIEAVENASKSAKIAVSISSVRLESNHLLVLHIDAGQLPSSSATRTARVLLAIADERDESHVRGGENSGRTLKHIAVLRNLSKVGILDQSSQFSRDVKVSIDHGNENVRLIAFVQDPKTGKIWGVGSARLSN